MTCPVEKPDSLNSKVLQQCCIKEHDDVQLAKHVFRVSRYCHANSTKVAIEDSFKLKKSNEFLNKREFIRKVKSRWGYTKKQAEDLWNTKAS
jgi:hypothetical protein